MSFNPEHSHRRPLTFPSVKPCESISYSTLINSLISLCTTISTFKSDYIIFTSNKRNVHNALRFIGLLRVFLEEIKDGAFKGKFVISPLSNLHVALQEFVFLLKDLTRCDARVWMLTRSEMVAGRFRAGFGSVVGSLESLPEEVVSGCDEEVRECFGFLTRQVKRAGFCVESDDVWALNAFGFALGRFESRVIPDPSELRRVMEYLGVKTWAECDDQVRFLEEVNGSFESDSESILGLVVYCRCVLFDHIDNKIEEDKNKYEFVISKTLNLDDFKCPISLEIMVDPVTISTGHTYDRSSIQKWFKSGSPVCPKTGERLQCLDLVPNVAIKSLIKQYCLENGVSLRSPKVKGSPKNERDYLGSLASEGAIKMVADFLLIKLALGTIVEKKKAIYEIRLLTKRSIFNRGCFVECGVIPYLLSLILVKESTIQENSMAALLNLSKHPKGRSVIVNNGGLSLVVGMLRNGVKMEARENAGAILFYLSAVEEYRESIGNNPDAIPSLVELIRVGGDQGKKNALVAIFGLLMLPSNHYKVLECRLVSLLVGLLDSVENEDLTVNSLAILSALAEKRDGAKAIFRARALDSILKVLCSSSFYSSRFRREYCVSLLLALCIHCGREVLEVLVKSTSLMGALYSLLVEGTSKGSKKANSLINLLHQFSEMSSAPSMSPHTMPHENFIHVW